MFDQISQTTNPRCRGETRYAVNPLADWISFLPAGTSPHPGTRGFIVYRYLESSRRYLALVVSRLDDLRYLFAPQRKNHAAALQVLVATKLAVSSQVRYFLNQRGRKCIDPLRLQRHVINPGTVEEGPSGGQ
ncbi:Citrinin polyketide synthase [Fusarium oxysporum f. sp. albedinis]|nr:Citrinin polyketide synthase [Fusarium oxysporum f. sp. albedinis]